MVLDMATAEDAKVLDVLQFEYRVLRHSSLDSEKVRPIYILQPECRPRIGLLTGNFNIREVYVLDVSNVESMGR